MNNIEFENLNEKAIKLNKYGVPADENHELFSYPSTFYLVGPPRSGKTSLTSNFLDSPQLYFEVFDTIAVISPTWKNYKKWIEDQRFCYADYSDHALNTIVNKARENKADDNGHTLLIMDDSKSSEAFKSSVFSKLMSMYRNINMTVMIAAQDFTMPLDLRNLIDNFIMWAPSKSNIPLVSKMVQSTNVDDDWLRNLLADNRTFENSHDFLVFKKKGGKVVDVLKNLNQRVVIPQ